MGSSFWRENGQGAQNRATRAGATETAQRGATAKLSRRPTQNSLSRDAPLTRVARVVRPGSLRRQMENDSRWHDAGCGPVVTPTKRRAQTFAVPAKRRTSPRLARAILHEVRERSFLAVHPSLTFLFFFSPCLSSPLLSERSILTLSAEKPRAARREGRGEEGSHRGRRHIRRRGQGEPPDSSTLPHSCHHWLTSLSPLPLCLVAGCSTASEHHARRLWYTHL